MTPTLVRLHALVQFACPRTATWPCRYQQARVHLVRFFSLQPFRERPLLYVTFASLHTPSSYLLLSTANMCRTLCFSPDMCMKSPPWTIHLPLYFPRSPSRRVAKVPSGCEWIWPCESTFSPWYASPLPTRAGDWAAWHLVLSGSRLSACLP